MGAVDEGDNTQTADSNVAIGYNALFGGILASSKDLVGNVAIGAGAMDSTASNAQTGTIAIGQSALTALTSGSENTAVGYQALDAETTGNFCTAIGYNALSAQTGTGGTIGNTAVGTGAGLGITTGLYNTAVGWLAADTYNTTGGTYLGQAAGSNGTGNYCVFVGMGSAEAGVNTSTGTVGVGFESLLSLTSGENNIAIGWKAGRAMTTSDGNTIIGHNAYPVGNNADGAGHNTIIGSEAALLATSADFTQNTFVGRIAGHQIASSACANNTGVGHHVFNNKTSGNNNVAVGRGAMGANQSGTGNTHIGANTESASATSNEIVLGSGVTGSGENSTTIGSGGVFKFASKQYTCDHADAEDGKSAASEASPLKLPAYSIIKSVSVIVTQLSNLGTFNVALYHSTDTAAPADDTALGGTPVEVLGVGAAGTSKSGSSGSASDIALGSGAVVKQSYFNGFGGAGLPVGTADRYIHVGQAGTGNGDTDPSTAGLISVLVEYVGLD